MALQLSNMHCNGWLADVNSFRSMRQVTIHRRPRSIPAHTRERAQATNAQQMGTAAYRRSPQGRACGTVLLPCERHGTARIPACRSGRAAQEPCPAPAVVAAGSPTRRTTHPTISQREVRWRLRVHAVRCSEGGSDYEQTLLEAAKPCHLGEVCGADDDHVVCRREPVHLCEQLQRSSSRCGSGEPSPAANGASSP